MFAGTALGRTIKRPAMSVNPRTISVSTSYTNPFGVAKTMTFPGTGAGASVNAVQINSTANTFAAGGLSPGTDDFTMECWFYPNSVNTGTQVFMFEQIYSGPTMAIYYGKFAVGKSMVMVVLQGATNLTAGSWYHGAVSRSSGTTRLFLNGVLLGSTTSVTNYIQDPAYNQTYIGAGQDSSTLASAFNGQICEARISTIARYTAAFTPPTAPFVNDQYTALLVHGDGANGSNIISDDNT
jgi:hypothetical protein